MFDEEYDETTDYYGDHYGEKGCCLTCEDAEPDCLCYNCRCRKCNWLEAQSCTWPSVHCKTWEDYKNEAQGVLEDAIDLWKKFPGILLKAYYSNGELSQTLYFFNQRDIQVSIPFHFDEKNPFRYRTLLLKKVEKEVVFHA